MIDQLFSYFKDFSWSKLFISWLFLALLVALIGLYESYTHHFELQSVNSALKLATEAEKYKKLIGSQLSKEETVIYLGALHSSERIINNQKSGNALRLESSKFIAGIAPWVLMAMVYIGGHQPSRFIGMFGAVIFGAISGALLSQLPDVIWPWGNLVLIPMLPFLFIMLIFGILSNRNKT